MTDGSDRKRCVVAYAMPDQQYLWAVDLPAQADISAAISAARALAGDIDVPWETAPVGVFGEPRSRTDVPLDGDRIELYRPLRSDPRERRREQVRRQRGSGR